MKAMMMAALLAIVSVPALSQAEDKIAQCIDEIYGLEGVYNEDTLRQNGCRVINELEQIERCVKIRGLYGKSISYTIEETGKAPIKKSHSCANLD